MATTDKSSPASPAKKPAPRRKSPAKAKSATSGTVAPNADEDRPAALKEEAGKVIGKLKNSAKDAASTGKDKTASTLEDVSAMVEDVARTIDAKVGPKYGAYARRAADTLSGVSDTLKSKDVDELLDDIRDFVRRKPAVAIGAAAALGFVLTRLLKADDNDAA